MSVEPDSLPWETSIESVLDVGARKSRTSTSLLSLYEFIIFRSSALLEKHRDLAISDKTTCLSEHRGDPRNTC